MSKNFELMQRVEKDKTFGSAITVEPEILSQGEGNNVNGHRRWASDEALRLVQQIFLLQAQAPPQVVVFAGIDHGGGCSQICVSVAETLAKNSRRLVCLVEANFRSPALPEFFGTTNHRGLTGALLQQGPISSFAKPVALENLQLISSGALAADSPSLLTSERLKERLAELRGEFDFVVIDAPPLTQYSDAIAVGKLADGLVLILEAEATRREPAAAVAANLRSANIPILAAVLNKRTFPIPENIYKRL
jgi:capsular exopolysaccharide synthesis family protein